MMIKNACTIGVRLTSAPLIFSSQHRLSGSVMTAESAPLLAIIVEILEHFSLTLCPDRVIGCDHADALGLPGRSSQIVSMPLSHGFRMIPLASKASFNVFIC